MLTILGNDINFKDYTAATVVAHWMPWFGTSGHITIGYVSDDQSVCDFQADAMREMGIDGINVDYYGQNSKSHPACLKMLNACERHGLSFSLCIDAGGAKSEADYKSIMQYSEDTFFNSKVYLRDTDRCIVNFFGEPSGVNWKNVRSSTATKLALVFQGSSGFTHAESDGGFGWVNPTTPVDNINLPALQAFKDAAGAHASKLALFPVYPGFDDSMAGWGKGRCMSRRLGQTLLDTLYQVPKDAKHVLLATWNDHEEGTGIEYNQG